MELVQAIFNAAPLALVALTSIVGSFAMIASVTPNKTDDRIAQVLMDLVNFLGFNFGSAANK